MKRLAIVFLLLVVSLHGCVSNAKVAVSPDFDLAKYKTIGVYRFEAPAGARSAGVAVADMFAIALMENGFCVVNRTTIEKQLDEMGLHQGAIVDPETISSVGKVLGTEGMLIGTVSQWKSGGVRKEFPAVGITCQLVDTETGQIVWATSGHDYGAYHYTPIQKVAQNVVDNIMRKLMRNIRR